MRRERWRLPQEASWRNGLVCFVLGVHGRFQVSGPGPFRIPQLQRMKAGWARNLRGQETLLEPACGLSPCVGSTPFLLLECILQWNPLPAAGGDSQSRPCLPSLSLNTVVYYFLRFGIINMLLYCEALCMVVLISEVFFHLIQNRK